MKILVTDGNTRPALAICRSLGQNGHEVIVADKRPSNLASRSRYCQQRCVYPDPVKHPETFISFLLEYVQVNRIDALLPVTDVTTIPLTENAQLFEQYCRIPFAGPEAIKRAADKVDIMALAESLDIDIPRSVRIDAADSLKQEQIEFDFPVVIKPAHSRIKTETGWIYTSVSYAKDFKDLKKQLKALDPRTFPLLIQERIIGPGLGIFLLFQNGSPVTAFSHRRIREKPPSGGVSVLRESTALDPLAFQASVKLLEALNWNGVAMVEFKIDERDSRPKLMEINGRFWGSLQLAIDAGVDFPGLLIRSINEKLPTDYDYTLGVKSRWLWGDIDALLARLLKNNQALQLPPESPGKFKYLLDFLRLWQPKTKYEVERLSDLRPWLFETGQWIKQMIGRSA